MQSCALCVLARKFSVVKIKGVTLALKKCGAIPIEVDGVLPELVLGRKAHEISSMKINVGKEKVDLGDVFEVKCDGDEALIFEGDLNHVKRIGELMSSGIIVVRGSAGMHLGERMSGGSVYVDGDIGARCCCEMRGGTVVVNGNVQAMLGSPLPGNTKGMRGGTIAVFGSVGARTGEGMRRGVIAVLGDAGDFAGVNMIAGTIVVFGNLGSNAGGGMKRGSIIALGGVEKILPTFLYACTYKPTYLRLYFNYLRNFGFPVTDDLFKGSYQRYIGDVSSLGKGEMLILEKP